MTSAGLSRRAKRLARLLAERRLRLVFAESCTCGLLAATLGEVPGISQWLSGSAVVYQEATKTAWLGVPDELIRRRGVVSGDVARAMAVGALGRTPHADIAAGITGHLGPNAPKKLDGVAYLGVAFREPGSSSPNVRVVRARFDAPAGRTPLAVRLERRRLAAAWVLDVLYEEVAPLS